MDSSNDQSLKLQRASTDLIVELLSLIPFVSWRQPGLQQQAHRYVKQHDLDNIVALVEPFQEEPQLLDAHLKKFLPSLVGAYLERLQCPTEIFLEGKPGIQLVPLTDAIGRILYTFCKVRGEKVITLFLNNEPRFLEPLLNEFERRNSQEIIKHNTITESMSWEERYVLQLWLSHLVLAPFDLASISSNGYKGTAQTNISGIEVPNGLPSIAFRIIPICTKYLQSPTRERNSAATLLVRLSLRPDMRKVGLLDSLIRWALSFFNTTIENLSDIHKCLGILTFISKLVGSATKEEIGEFLFDIFKSCQSIVNQETLMFVRSSAVARKLIIKIFRNIVIHCLQCASPYSDMDTSIPEDVIDFLLNSMSDGDTPVRYAASKALSMISMKLEPEMATEVIEAILGCFNEDVLWEESSRNLSMVNPLKWHGLTLALSHLLYRRAPPTEQLPDILNALILALTFEQRLATGSAVGTNVRDAACFGIWALSRRYTTKELLAVETSSIRAASTSSHALSVPQTLAIELLSAACLDPAGNIRRGSSAALQELVGRHPDTVYQGIPLVQIVDFHAVGLRDRAMREVGLRAARLSKMYWDALFDSLLGWRGACGLDVLSRMSSAATVGLLGSIQPPLSTRSLTNEILVKLKGLSLRAVEERHGLLLSLSALVSPKGSPHSSPSQALSSGAQYPRLVNNPSLFQNLWSLLENGLGLSEKDFTSITLRPELTAIAVCSFISALARLSVALNKVNYVRLSPTLRTSVVRFLNLLHLRPEETVLQAIPEASKNVFLILSQEQRVEIAQSWISPLLQSTSNACTQGFGKIVSLGAIFSTLKEDGDDRCNIIEVLTSRCKEPFAIKMRVVALESLQRTFPTLITNKSASAARLEHKTFTTIFVSLNDYTINERGDVGSLVRLAGLDALESGWLCGLFTTGEDERALHAAVIRLSVEKLDKVRARAARCLEVTGREHFERASIGTSMGVSSQAYFRETLKLLQGSTPPTLRSVLLEGYISAAGMGSEAVVRAARAALIEVLDPLPTVGDSSVRAPFGLIDVATTLLEIFKLRLTSDRIVLPMLEVLAFLFDMRILQRLEGSGFSFTNLLSLVQRSHFKSSNIHKLRVALDVYRGLADIHVIRGEVIKKVCSMLLHPFPKVRITAAEALLVVTGTEKLKSRDWSSATKELRGIVEEVRREITFSG